MRGIVNDRVDPGDLLKDGKPDGDHKGRVGLPGQTIRAPATLHGGSEAGTQIFQDGTSAARAGIGLKDGYASES